MTLKYFAKFRASKYLQIERPPRTMHGPLSPQCLIRFHLKRRRCEENEKCEDKRRKVTLRYNNTTSPGHSGSVCVYKNVRECVHLHMYVCVNNVYKMFVLVGPGRP
jgi:hypothetical protein